MQRSDDENRWLRLAPGEMVARKAEHLVRFLNAPSGDEESQRVLELFRLCCQLEALGPRPTIAANNLRRAINAISSDFRVRPILLGQEWQWTAAHPGKPAREEVKAGAKLEVTPVFAFKVLTDIMTAGMLHRVKKCICGMWFFAGSRKKTVCSDKCRAKKFTDSNESFRAERAVYMRRYRKAAEAARRAKIIKQRRAKKAGGKSQRKGVHAVDLPTNYPG